MISDLMGQLQSATEQGWERTKPDHYRSILAALESALEQRRAIIAAPGSERRDEPANCVAAPRLAAPTWPGALRWSFLRLLLCLVPVRSQ
jgi:hypothetical protein